MDWLNFGSDEEQRAVPVGPQTDGTNLISGAAISIVPTDTAGGQPAQYGQDILDVFKFGVQAWSDSNARSQLFEYKKFEATRGGLFQQGRGAFLSTSRNGGGVSPFVMMAAAAVVVLVVLTRKG
jgi:hypothetical protein